MKLLRHLTLIFAILIFSYCICFDIAICDITNKKNEALIIMAGELGSRKEVDTLIEYFDRNCEYNVFNADWKDRTGLEDCYIKLKKRMSEINISKYDKVHFFSFILVGKLLRYYLQNDIPDNLGRIVLLRGPLEERILNISIDIYPNWILRMKYGKKIFEMAKIEYKDFGNIHADIGMIIETEPNELAKNIVKRIKEKYTGDDPKYTTTFFHPDSIMKGYKDFTYLAMDHNEMYTMPEKYIDLVITFIKNGTFNDITDRQKTNYTIDFFPVYSSNKK